MSFLVLVFYRVFAFVFAAASTYTVYEVAIGETCQSTESMCPRNAECRYDAYGTARCLCKDGYVQAYVERMAICASIIKVDTDPACVICESNGETCYDTDGDKKKDGCACPSLLYGQNDCARSYVSVKCKLDNFTMFVCYDPQPEYDFDKGGAILVEGKDFDEACQGHMVSVGSVCPVGQYQLALPLSESERTRCNTKRFISDDDAADKYETLVVIQHDLNIRKPDDLSFVASCSFDLDARLKTDRANHEPQLSFSIENALGQPIPEGVALRLGDQVRFKILLADDGIYTALKVVKCFASAATTSPTALGVPLILQGCPAIGQNQITTSNNWHQLSGKRNVLKTGLVKMFKLSPGDSLRIHCSVKVCLKGTEADCTPAPCTGGARPEELEINYSPTPEFIVWREIDWFKMEDTEKSTEIKAVPLSVVVGMLTMNLLIFMALVASLCGLLSKILPNNSWASNLSFSSSRNVYTINKLPDVAHSTPTNTNNMQYI